MKKIISLFIGAWVWIAHAPIFAQNYVSNDPIYIENVTKADSAHEAKDFALCSSCYEKAFTVSQKSYKSLIMASQCLVMSNQPEPAFEYLNKALDLNWEYTELYIKDTDELDGVKETADWKKFIQRLDEKRAAYEATLNIPLRNELDSMMVLDQKYRAMMDSVGEEFGWNSTEMQALWKEQNAVDSTNTVRMVAILNEYGYPGNSLVGSRTSRVGFFIIQHADLNIQTTYLPLLTEAADSGELAWSLVAMLVDRVRMRQGEPQLYGSQVTKDSTGKSQFHPIEDEAHVNERREKVGLGPIEGYAKYFGIDYSFP